jgi:hypothetical protein
MRLQRWWRVILSLGLFMGLTPLNAQAGPHRTFAPQPNRQAFTRPQPRAFANGWQGRPQQWQQTRGNAYGWNGQNRQWHQPRWNAAGWQGQSHNWQQRRGQAVGWNGGRSQWQQHPENVAGWNGPHRQSSGQEYRPGYQQFQSPNQNQENSRPAFTPIGYSGTHQAPSISTGSFTAPSNPSGQWSRSYPQSGFHGPQSSGSSHQVPAEPTQVSN